MDMNLRETVFYPLHLGIITYHYFHFINRKAEVQGVGVVGEATCPITQLLTGKAALWTQPSLISIPCYFYYAVLLLETQSAKSS